MLDDSRSSTCIGKTGTIYNGKEIETSSTDVRLTYQKKSHCVPVIFKFVFIVEHTFVDIPCSTGAFYSSPPIAYRRDEGGIMAARSCSSGLLPHRTAKF